MTATTRAEHVTKLRQLADLLDEHPAIPHEQYSSITTHLELDDYDTFEQLVTYLETSGIEHRVSRGDDRRVVTILGGLYRVLVLTSESMRQFDARHSYAGVIEVEPEHVP